MKSKGARFMFQILGVVAFLATFFLIDGVVSGAISFGAALCTLPFAAFCSIQLFRLSVRRPQRKRARRAPMAPQGGKASSRPAKNIPSMYTAPTQRAA